MLRRKVLSPHSAAILSSIWPGSWSSQEALVSQHSSSSWQLRVAFRQQSSSSSHSSSSSQHPAPAPASAFLQMSEVQSSVWGNCQSVVSVYRASTWVETFLLSATTFRAHTADTLSLLSPGAGSLMLTLGVRITCS